MNIVPLNYKGEPIRFNTDGWINATDIAKRFGKRLDHWLSNTETLEYVRALDEVYSGEPSKILHTRDSGYVKTSKARKDRGRRNMAASKVISCLCKMVRSEILRMVRPAH
ncbi:KilA-N domain-containing protein [Salmonella enterica subsp. enterica serovar Typhimurium]